MDLGGTFLIFMTMWLNVAWAKPKPADRAGVGSTLQHLIIRQCRGEHYHVVHLDQASTVRVECVPCSKCPEGSGVVRHCTADSDTVCEECEPGKTYSDTVSRRQACRPCKKCQHTKTKRQCQSYHNTVCGGCEPGYFRDYFLHICRKCSYCFPEMPGVTIRTRQCMTSSQPHDYQCLPIRLTHQADNRTDNTLPDS